MEREISRACLQSPNQIREIVVDSESEEEKYSTMPTFATVFNITASKLNFSASSSKKKDGVGNVAGQQTQPCLWTQPPQPWGV
jgi:hypothetical protein